jgi:hypothetical protein
MIQSKGIIPLQLKSFEEAVRAAKEEQLLKSNVTKKERTSHSLNNRRKPTFLIGEYTTARLDLC